MKITEIPQSLDYFFQGKSYDKSVKLHFGPPGHPASGSTSYIVRQLKFGFASSCFPSFVKRREITTF
jgi:hypothetical protein